MVIVYYYQILIILIVIYYTMFVNVGKSLTLVLTILKPDRDVRSVEILEKEILYFQMVQHLALDNKDIYTNYLAVNLIILLKHFL